MHDTPGPVLWTGLIEAVNRTPHEDYEAFLCQGLETRWVQVRYAAAMAIATRAKQSPLHPNTLIALRQHQQASEDFPIRLTASYALLSCGESDSLAHLLQFLLPCIPTEVRKAASFILATEFPCP